MEIYVMDADGRNQRRLTRNASPNTNPSWSPDGKRIIFVSTRHGNPEIYTMNADGPQQVRRLTKNPFADRDPTWFDPAFAVAPFAVAPTGKKITIWGWLKQVDQ
jgi:Tol biopolymer transport system component